MEEDEYEPELDEALLADWCSFCEGAEQFEKYHFSTILMGVFLGGLTPQVDSFLCRFSNSFPPVLYNNLVRICSDVPTERDLVPWIRRDLDQKLELLDAGPKSVRKDIERFLIDKNFTFTDDFASLPDIARASTNFDAIYFAESEYVVNLCGRDAKMHTLLEALYHIATNYSLAHALMSSILDGEVDLSNYLEIYLRGGDYVVTTDSILVFQFQDEPDSA